MIRSLILTVLVIGCSMGLTGCGLLANQVNRAANILTTPRRLTFYIPPRFPEGGLREMTEAFRWS